MKAIILAAGKGKRLQPLTLDTPKPLIEILGKPIINRLLESLPSEIDEALIVVDYLRDKIEAHVGNMYDDKKITYVTQGEKTGTFGALLSAKHLLEKGERFLVLNADDTHAKAELAEYLKHSRSFGVQKMIMPHYYSMQVDPLGFITGWKPQTEEEKANGALIATGVYVLDTTIFDHPGVVVFGGEYGLPQTIIEQKEDYPIKAVVTRHWMPVNSFEDLKRAEEYLREVEESDP